MRSGVRKSVAKRVRQLRCQRGWSQEELADRAVLHRTYVGKIERAEQNFTVDILDKLATAFGVSVQELLSTPCLDTPVCREHTTPAQKART